jgi:hypothetical protein
LNALQEVIQYTFIKFCIYCFSLWYEFFVYCALRVEKIINVVSMRDLRNFSFFGRGDVSPTHSEQCHFVFGVIGKTSDLISRINFVKKKSLSTSAIAIMSWQDVTRSSLCSGVKECGTKRALSQIFFQNPMNYSLGDVQRFCNHALCDSMVILTKSATAAMCISVRVEFGWPLLSSSSTSSHSSRNQDYHLKTFDRFRASFP